MPIAGSFGMVSYQEMADALGCTRPAARHRVAKVVARFLKAYDPAMSDAEAYSRALRPEVQVAIRNLVEKTYVKGW